MATSMLAYPHGSRRLWPAEPGFLTLGKAPARPRGGVPSRTTPMWWRMGAGSDHRRPTPLPFPPPPAGKGNGEGAGYGGIFVARCRGGIFKAGAPISPPTTFYRGDDAQAPRPPCRPSARQPGWPLVAGQRCALSPARAAAPLFRMVLTCIREGCTIGRKRVFPSHSPMPRRHLKLPQEDGGGSFPRPTRTRSSAASKSSSAAISASTKLRYEYPRGARFQRGMTPQQAPRRADLARCCRERFFC